MRASDGVAGAGLEYFAQILSAPLVQGQQYELSAWLHQALRPDLNVPSGYDVAFEPGPAVVHLGDTTSPSAGWNLFSGTFVAQGGETMIHFRSTAGYAGVDAVELRAVPEPASLWVVGVGLAALLRRRR